MKELPSFSNQNKSARQLIYTCVLGNVIQQQRVLGHPLHFYRDDVFELQPATQTVALSFLKNDNKEEEDGQQPNASVMRQ